MLIGNYPVHLIDDPEPWNELRSNFTQPIGL